MRVLLKGLLIVLLMLAALPARAETVQIRHGQLTLLGDLELAEGKTLADGVLLMVHGTLAHKDMEIIQTLQELLKERGISSLAITLSLGFDARKGMFDCNQPMRHRHEDAVAEIDAWVRWLKDKGAKEIWLFGHSRGGNQVALYLAEKADAAVKKAVLLAPMTFDPAKAPEKYEKRFGQPLGPVLRHAANLARAGKGGRFIEVPGILYCKDARATPESFLSYHSPTNLLDTPWVLAQRVKGKVPVLVIAGSEDKVVPDLPARMKALGDVPGVKFITIEDADHFFRDLAAEDVADAIAEFLTGA